jgi:hypothetical protein
VRKVSQGVRLIDQCVSPVLTLLSNQIQRLTAFIQDVAKCLRPGGLATFIEWDYQIYTPEHIPYTSSTPTYDPSALTPQLGERPLLQSEHLPALVHLLRAILRASTTAGSHITGSRHIGVFVQRNGEYKDINIREVWIPVVAKPGWSPSLGSLSVTPIRCRPGGAETGARVPIGIYG